MAAEKKEAGNKAYAEKDFDGAISAYSEAIALEPENHIFYSNRSLAYGGKGDWEKAAADAQECVKKDPTFVKGYYRLATAQVELGQFDVAAATIREGLKGDSTNVELQKLMRQLKAKKAAVATAAKRAASGAPAKQIDEQTRQEASELNEQLQQAGREMQETQLKLQACRRETRRTELTTAEVSALGDATPMYRSVGKMFLLSTKPEIQAHLVTEAEGTKKRESDLTARQAYLQRKLGSLELNMKDLMAGSA